MKDSRTEKTIQVIQGAFHVSAEADVVLTAILGSCISACLFDPVARVGGMNHFLLPGNDATADNDRRYGKDLTQGMIASLEKHGAERHRLQAKIFGGSQIIPGMVHIGGLNSEFAYQFLLSKQIPIVMRSVGGERARRIKFWPTTGRAQQLLLDPISYESVGRSR